MKLILICTHSCDYSLSATHSQDCKLMQKSWMHLCTNHQSLFKFPQGKILHKKKKSLLHIFFYSLGVTPMLIQSKEQQFSFMELMELNWCNDIKERFKYIFLQDKREVSQWLWFKIKIWLKKSPFSELFLLTHSFTSFRPFISSFGYIRESKTIIIIIVVFVAIFLWQLKLKLPGGSDTAD